MTVVCRVLGRPGVQLRLVDSYGLAQMRISNALRGARLAPGVGTVALDDGGPRPLTPVLSSRSGEGLCVRSRATHLGGSRHPGAWTLGLVAVWDRRPALVCVRLVVREVLLKGAASVRTADRLQRDDVVLPLTVKRQGPPSRPSLVLLQGGSVR